MFQLTNEVVIIRRVQFTVIDFGNISPRVPGRAYLLIIIVFITTAVVGSERGCRESGPFFNEVFSIGLLLQHWSRMYILWTMRMWRWGRWCSYWCSWCGCPRCWCRRCLSILLLRWSCLRCWCRWRFSSLLLRCWGSFRCWCSRWLSFLRGLSFQLLSTLLLAAFSFSLEQRKYPFHPDEHSYWRISHINIHCHLIGWGIGWRINWKCACWWENLPNTTILISCLYLRSSRWWSSFTCPIQ